MRLPSESRPHVGVARFLLPRRVRRRGLIGIHPSPEAKRPILDRSGGTIIPTRQPHPMDAPCA